MPTYSQHDRMMKVESPLGKDALLLEQFNGSESMSELFSFELDLLSPGESVEFDKVIGQNLLIKMRLPVPGEKYRFFHGLCIRMGDLGSITGAFGHVTFRRYNATIVPKLWLLTKQSTSRTFQHKTIPQILEEVLGAEGIAFKNQIQGSFEKRDYVCQYRETNFAFISRLMEEEGIYYYFEHTEGAHTMILGNNSSSAKPLSASPKLKFDRFEGEFREDNRIESWVKSQEIRSGKVLNWDHSFEMPHRNQETVQTIQSSVKVGKIDHKLGVGGGSKLEIYDFPGGYAQRFDGIDKGGSEQGNELSKINADGKRTVSIRQEQEAAQSMRISGTGTAAEMGPGFTFGLAEHGEGDGEYLLTSVQHHGTAVGVYTGEDGGGEGYRNSFNVSPKGLPFRPQRNTPKPMMIGTTTALVVGPGGAEIFTDKHGRVKVHFHWDRGSKSDADSSCWVRVATMWAGTNWGMVHVPRIGQEVVVAFEEGDPDRPIVVGSVYNSRETPPYKLPDNMTQFGIKSRSSPGGDTTNFNELRFEDKKGKEHIFFHAEKDFTRVVENNDIEVIGYKTLEDSNIKTSKVKEKDQAWEVYNDRFEQIGVSSGKGSLTTIIEKHLTTTLNKGDETHTIKKGSRIVKIRKHDKLTIEKGDQTLKIKTGSREATIKQNDKLKLESGSQELKIEQGERKAEIFGNDKLELKTGNMTTKIASGSRTTTIKKDDTTTVESGNQVTKIKQGTQTTKVDAGAAKHEAMKSITLKCGPSKIELTPSGITISAPMIEIKAKAKASIGAPMVEVKGQGMTMIKGGIVMIN